MTSDPEMRDGTSSSCRAWSLLISISGTKDQVIHMNRATGGVLELYFTGLQRSALLEMSIIMMRPIRLEAVLSPLWIPPDRIVGVHRAVLMMSMSSYSIQSSEGVHWGCMPVQVLSQQWWIEYHLFVSLASDDSISETYHI
jgi:hypothetical protein